MSEIWIVHTTEQGASIAKELGYPPNLNLSAKYGRASTPYAIPIQDKETAFALSDLLAKENISRIVTRRTEWSLPKFKDFFQFCEDTKSQVESIIDTGGYVLFFKMEKDTFGASEDSRVVFARMKQPDDEMPKNWEKEASFSAENLNKNIRGEPAQQVFHKKDLSKIRIIDREEAIRQLGKIAEKQGGLKKPTPLINLSKLIHFHHDPDEAPNFVRADED